MLVLHDFAFRGLVTDQHQDLLSFWLPNHCFLGGSLASGSIPSWNPHVMAGLPFAADPQSGWMYLPAMVLYSLFPCAVALRVFIIAQPIIAGLSLFWFLRTEGLSRAAATIGGLSVALAICGSTFVISLPLSGSIAWTALLLAVLARFIRASSWSARIGWALLGAVVWGQVAAAHLSNGLVLSTLLAVTYLVAHGISDVRAGRRTAWEVAVLLALWVGLLLPVNLAYLLPRMLYLSRSSLGLGYDGLHQLAAQLGRPRLGPFQPDPGASLSWPLRFGVSPGAYLGALPLIMGFGGMWSRRHRLLGMTFALVSAASYLLSLDVVVRWSAPLVRHLPFGDFYLHEPTRFGYGLLLILPVLGALGIDAWRSLPSRREQLLVPAVGLLVWLGLPLLLAVDPARLILLAVAAAVGLGLLVASRHLPILAVALPAVVAIELVVNGLVGQSADNEVNLSTEAGGEADVPFVNLLEPRIESGDYLRGGPIVAALRARPGRVLGIGTPHGSTAHGRSSYLSAWDPRDRGYPNNQRAILFGIEDAEGYNPAQLRPYWIFVRRGSPIGMRYNRVAITNLSPTTLDLLDVRWIVAPTGDRVTAGLEPVVSEGTWTLYARSGSARATLVHDWRVISDESVALEAVAENGFDPDRLLILNVDPGIDPAGGGLARPEQASFEWLGPQGARVVVEASDPAILLVRNAYDPNWRATLDGEAVEVLRADFLLQGVPVPAGRHVILLSYDDPTIGYGLIGSGASVGVSLTVGLVLWARGRRPHGG